MGSVYRATHLGTDRVVAIKLIDRRYTGNADLLERFKREARAAGRLVHPNVVDVTDFGIAVDDTGQTAYLVMEYLEGCTLAEVLSEIERPPLLWVVEVFEQICSAVSAAHDHGILHRDIKPSNIWLESDRLGGFQAKVLDFGLARFDQSGDDRDDSLPPPADRAKTEALAAPGAENPKLPTVVIPSKLGAAIEPAPVDDTLVNESDARAKGHSGSSASALVPSWDELTRIGSLLGTPHYMSPEQCRGERVNARSDIYSLGVMLFQMLAGELPFRSDKDGDVMAKHMHAPPPSLKKINRAVPKAVSDLVQAALAKDPDDRPATASLFATQLRGRAETIGPVVQRAIVLCVSHLSVFLRLFVLIYTPVLAVQACMRWITVENAGDFSGRGLTLWGLAVFGGLVAESFAVITVRGLATLILTQVLMMRMRQPKLRRAIGLLKLRRLQYPKALATFFAVNVLPFNAATSVLTLSVGLISGSLAFSGPFARMHGLEIPAALLCVVPVVFFLVVFARYCLYPIVFIVEDRVGVDGASRARDLAYSGWRLVLSIVAVDFALWGIESVVERVAIIALFGFSPAGQVAKVVFFIGFQVLVAPLLAIAYAMLYINLRLGSGETLQTILRPFGAAHSEKSTRVQSVVGEIRSLSGW